MATTQMTSPCRPEASNMATVPSSPIAPHFQRLALASGSRARATAYTAINAPAAERPLEWVWGPSWPGRRSRAGSELEKTRRDQEPDDGDEEQGDLELEHETDGVPEAIAGLTVHGDGPDDGEPHAERRRPSRPLGAAPPSRAPKRRPPPRTGQGAERHQATGRPRPTDPPRARRCHQGEGEHVEDTTQHGLDDERVGQHILGTRPGGVAVGAEQDEQDGEMLPADPDPAGLDEGSNPRAPPRRSAQPRWQRPR